MSLPFVEDWASPKVDPLAPAQTIGFDWPSLYAACGEGDGEDHLVNRAAETAHAIFQFCLSGARCKPENIGRNALALAAMTNPNLFGGASISEVARMHKLHPSALSRITAELVRKYPALKPHWLACGDAHRKPRPKIKSGLAVASKPAVKRTIPRKSAALQNGGAI